MIAVTVNAVAAFNYEVKVMSDIIVNKVVKGDETYLDLTNDTVSEGTLLKNRTAHNSEGIQIQGTMEEGGGSVTGVKGDAESVYRDGNVNITAANVGTYTASQIDTLLNEKVDVHGTDSLMTNAEHVKLAGIEAGAEENVIESISLNGEEITPVNKAVALSVIDKDVNDLTNYYKKSEIDTSLGAKQNRVLASTLNIGGQTIGNVEGALSALNESKSDLVNGKVPVNELPVYTPVIGSIQSIGGIVPPSSSGDEDKYLRSDGTWAKPAGGGGGVSDYDDLTNRPKINGTTLSEDKTGTQLGLQNIILSSTLSIGGQTVTEVEEALGSLAGISKPMTGATSSAAGEGGFVPSPSAGDENKALFGDGTWKPVSGGGGGGHAILDEDGITYPQRSKLQFEGCEITDDAVNGITVVKCEGGGVKKYAKPVITVGTYTYDGTTQAPTITGFDANVMTLTGTYEAINAGSYTFTIALSDKTSSKWEDDTQDDIVTNWSIDAISVAVPTVTNTTKTYNGSAQSPTITRDTANTSISGTTSATKVKSNYSFSIALTDTTNHKWSDNTTAAKSYTWKINPPTGSSYTPVNNIQAWLQCASIDKTYTTIAQVLADATTLSALMLSNNAADYLARSTSWVSNITGNQTAMTDIGASNYCANKLLADSTWRTAICNSTYFESVLTTKSPNMTSNTTPSGTVSASYVYSGRAAWWAFDGNIPNGSTGEHYWWASTSVPQNLNYTFDSPITVYKVSFISAQGSNPITGSIVKLQYSSDNATWVDAYTWTMGSEAGRPSVLVDKTGITKTSKVKYYRFLVTKSVGSGVAIGTVHLYGRA